MTLPLDAFNRREMISGSLRSFGAVSMAGVALNAAFAEPASNLTNLIPEWAPRSDRKIRIGVVGGGFGSVFPWSQHPNCTVHAVSDLIPGRREHLSKVFSCDRPYESLEKLILDEEVEAVAVFTGPPDHARHCIAVMNAGKHCISAVPSVMTLEEANSLKEAKESTGVKYMLAETSAYYPPAHAVKDYYEKELFGSLFFSQLEYAHPVSPENDEGARTRAALWFADGKPTWRHGFPPMLYPTHGAGLLVNATRERFTSVSCLGWAPPNDPVLTNGANQYKNPFSAEFAVMRTDKGHVCYNRVEQAGNTSRDGGDLFGSKLTVFQANGAAGHQFAVFGENADKCIPPHAFINRLPKQLRKEGEAGHGGAEAFIVHEFISALTEDREPQTDIYEALAMNVCGIVGHQSALRGGELMSIPSFDRA